MGMGWKAHAERQAQIGQDGRRVEPEGGRADVIVQPVLYELKSVTAFLTAYTSVSSTGSKHNIPLRFRIVPRPPHAKSGRAVGGFKSAEPLRAVFALFPVFLAVSPHDAGPVCLLFSACRTGLVLVVWAIGMGLGGFRKPAAYLLRFASSGEYELYTVHSLPRVAMVSQYPVSSTRGSQCCTSARGWKDYYAGCSRMWKSEVKSISCSNLMDIAQAAPLSWFQ